MSATTIVLVALGALVVVGLVMFVIRRRRPSAEVPVSRDVARPPDRSRRAFGDALRAVFGASRIDGGFWDGLEEALLGADVGVAATTEIVDRVRAADPADPDAAWRALHREMLAVFDGADRSLHLQGRPAVVMVVGVNGVGKTTSIAKLAARLKAEGRSPLLGAADTFRAAADSQLRTWAERVGVEIVGGQQGADPAAVAFDAYAAARARGRDVVIVDTAGRLHSKQNLMAELEKIRRVLVREAGDVDEVLLVLDATAGQNGIVQARQFAEAVGVTGVILTKLDGTARGGIVVAVEAELGVPVKFVGLGEALDDLVVFEPETFVKALLSDA